jgi:uncharacterized protein YqhQ
MPATLPPPKSKLSLRTPRFLKFGWLMSSSMAVGGQAVIEGVMMRSPNSMAVAVRRPHDKKIVIKEFQWVSLSTKLPILKKPVLRGMTVLVEAMMNGIQALSFSAEQSSIEEKKPEEKESVLTKSAIAMSIVTAFGMGIFMFVVLPHLLTELVGRLFFKSLAVNTFGFHFIDGVIKMTIFIVYILAISLMKDIRRVFQYHGAEHKSIFAYEKQLPLAIDEARVQSRFHPRCGTSFILTVILASILIFSAFFPLLPRPDLPPIMTSLLFALIKIPLMLPIVGLSYEFIKLMGSDSCPTWLRSLSKPGLLMQNLTTREPDDEQLEVGLASLKACLWRETNLVENPKMRDNLVEFENIASPVFEQRLASQL